MEVKRDNPTDFLVSMLGKIEGAEDVIVILGRGEGKGYDIEVSMNNIPAHQVIGMLEFAKLDAFQSLFETDEEGD